MAEKQNKPQGKIGKFASLTKDFASVLAIDGRESLAEGLVKVAEKVQPTDEQLKWASSKRNEWEQKAKADKARKEREACQVRPGTATA
jgi:hypothetical protein